MSQISFSKRVKLLWKTYQVSWRFRFAHHPLCERFEGQVWKLRSMYLCQGCTLAYLGVLTGFLLFFAFNISLSPINWLAVGSFCLLLPLIIESIGVDRRLIKRIIRYTTGIGIGSLFWLLLSEPDFVMKVGAIIFAVVGFQVFRFIRGSSERQDTCEACPELHTGGICSGLEMEAEAMRKYSDYATSLLEEKIKAKYLRKNQEIGFNYSIQDNI